MQLQFQIQVELQSHLSYLCGAGAKGGRELRQRRWNDDGRDSKTQSSNIQRKTLEKERRRKNTEVKDDVKEDVKRREMKQDVQQDVKTKMWKHEDEKVVHLMESSPMLLSGKVGEHAARGSGEKRREDGGVKRKTEQEEGWDDDDD